MLTNSATAFVPIYAYFWREITGRFITDHHKGRLLSLFMAADFFFVFARDRLAAQMQAR